MTQNDVIRRAVELFEKYGISYQFMSGIQERGWAWSKEGEVVINPDQEINMLASAVLHELAHVLCYREGKYLNYHSYGKKTRHTVKLAKNRIRTGLRAERYVDKYAKKLMKKYYPELKYVPGYGDEDSLKWFYNYMKPFRDLIERNK